MSRSDRTLKRYYRRYKRQYPQLFGSLPDGRDIIIRWGDKRSDRDGLKSAVAVTYSPAIDKEPWEIVFDKTLRRLKFWNIVKLTLFHEMCHVASRNRDNHGPAFQRRMKMLAANGAFRWLW